MKYRQSQRRNPYSILTTTLKVYHRLQQHLDSQWSICTFPTHLGGGDFTGGGEGGDGGGGCGDGASTVATIAVNIRAKSRPPLSV